MIQSNKNARIVRLVGLCAIGWGLVVGTSHATLAEDVASLDGMTVDERGEPLAGVTVEGLSLEFEPTVTSDAGGQFRLPLPAMPYAGFFLIKAKHEDGRQGVFRWEAGIGTLQGERAVDRPIRIALKEPRQVTIDVVDSNGLPVGGAEIVILTERVAILVAGVTNEAGRWTARIPANAMCDQIAAFKSGAGFDHICLLEEPRSNKHKPLPERIKLMLAGTRAVRIKTVDTSGEPIANVALSWIQLRSEGQIDSIALSLWKNLRVFTDETGTASFDWLSPNTDAMLVAFSPEYGRMQPSTIRRGVQAVDMIFQLVRRAKLSGRVLFPDGRAAPKILVNGGSDITFTDASGMYEILVDPNKSHIVTVINDDWVAASHVGVLVRESQEVPRLDFTLTPGVVLRGQVVLGSDRRPLQGSLIYLSLVGGPLEPLVAPARERQSRATWKTTTDREGKYHLRVFPGTYELRMLSPVRPVMVSLSDQAEVVQDFHLPRAPSSFRENRAKISVVDEQQKPAASARIQATSRSPALQYVGMDITDGEGKFEFLLPLIPAVFQAQTPDGRTAGIVRIETDDAPRVIRLAPTATARGRLLNDRGRAIAGARLRYGIRVHEDIAKPEGPAATSFGGIVTTDAQGSFELRTLVPGEEYVLESEAEIESNRWSALSTIKAVKPEAIEIGDIRLRAAD